jgi:uncharacterized repeat protein (TIGR03803 family)
MHLPLAASQRWCLMRVKLRMSTSIRVIIVVAATLLFASGALAASSYKVLYAFKGGNDGNYPAGALALDAAGNLYGTTVAGGGDQQFCSGSNPGCGTVFMLTNSNGKWKERVLHHFQIGNHTSDGSAPNGGLIFDTAGNLYGTTSSGGGATKQCSSGAGQGCGIVFELSPTSGGSWTESVLHRFQTNRGGAGPYGGVVFDDAGNLYGTDAAAGDCCEPPIFGWGAGVVFRLEPTSSGWNENILHSFCSLSKCSDGNAPYAGLLRAADGTLYGTTAYGGGNSFPCNNLGCGTVFKLAGNSDGSWSEQVLHAFTGKDGVQTSNGLTADSKGNLYGTTAVDGAFGDGTVFKLTLTSDGQWRFRVLYNFRIEYAGSGSFSTGVVFDHAGNLYGTIWGPPSGNCNGGGCGLIYKLTPQPSGPWKYSVVHTFEGNDGGDPTSTLIIDKNGNLYGTTGIGGANGYGVVFELTP